MASRFGILAVLLAFALIATPFAAAATYATAQNPATMTQGVPIPAGANKVPSLSTSKGGLTTDVYYLGPLSSTNVGYGKGDEFPQPTVQTTTTSSSTTGFFTLGQTSIDEFYIVLALLLAVAGILFFLTRDNYRSYAAQLHKYLYPSYAERVETA